MEWSPRSIFLASTFAAATIGTLVYLRRSVQEHQKALAQLRAAPKRRPTKRRPQEPQKHTLGQVSLPKSEFYPKPPTDEVDPVLILTPEEIEALSKYPHALQYKLSEEQLQVRTLLAPGCRRRFFISRRGSIFVQVLDEDGYLVIRKLIPDAACDKMLKEIDERATKLYKTNSADLDNDSSQSIFLDVCCH
jgi:hypothetical protein